MASLKICGITRAEDWALCEQLGVDYIGLNFWSASKRGLSLAELRDLVAQRQARRDRASPGALASARKAPKVVGLFVDPTIEWVQQVMAELKLDLVQLHGDKGPEDYPEWPCAQIWVIRGTPELTELAWPQRRVDHVILDAKVEGYGGQGARGDWDWAHRFVDKHPQASVWLAGGITPDNACSALAQVGCQGLDVASGAELAGATRGEKDPDKIARLLRACRDESGK